MNCKNNKLKHRCGVKTPSTCVFYDLELPEISKLKILDDCISIEDTTSDTYSLIDSIFKSIDTSTLGTKCLTYTKVADPYNPLRDVILVKDVLLKHEDEICKLKNESSENDCCVNLNEVDFKCLSDPCNNLIDTQLKLIQALIDKICALEQRVIILEDNNG